MQQGMAHEEIVQVECRVRRIPGKLVEGRAVLTKDCRILELQLDGEFFADPELDEKLTTLIGRDARNALQEIENILREVHAEPHEDIASCIKRLLLCG